MPRFERRITDEQIAAARKKIAAGTSLRSAAAEVPCAPSTLSDRIAQAEVAEREALERAGIRTRGQSWTRRDREEAEASNGFLGPVEVLRGALSATRPSGQPDWPTRVTAARALAQLRPELVAHARDERPRLVVYDLPAGTPAVLHRPQPTFEQEPPNEPVSTEYQLPVTRGVYFFHDVDRDRIVHLADVGVNPEEEGVVPVCFVESGEEARDVYRAVGGDLAQLDALLAGGPETKKQRRTRSAKSRRPCP